MLTPAGEAMVESAEAMEATAGQVAEAAARQSREASGTVKLTVAEIFAVTLLAPILRDLRKAHPGSGSSSIRPRRSATSPPAKPTSRCA